VAVRRSEDPGGEDDGGDVPERMKAEGREEGVQKGMEDGLPCGAESTAGVRCSQREQRLGPPSEEDRERSRHILLERLNRWGRRVMTRPRCSGRCDSVRPTRFIRGPAFRRDQ